MQNQTFENDLPKKHNSWATTLSLIILDLFVKLLKYEYSLSKENAFYLKIHLENTALFSIIKIINLYE